MLLVFMRTVTELLNSYIIYKEGNKQFRFDFLPQRQINDLL